MWICVGVIYFKNALSKQAEIFWVDWLAKSSVSNMCPPEFGRLHLQKQLVVRICLEYSSEKILRRSDRVLYFGIPGFNNNWVKNERNKKQTKEKYEKLLQSRLS